MIILHSSLIFKGFSKNFKTFLLINKFYLMDIKQSMPLIKNFYGKYVYFFNML